MDGHQFVRLVTGRGIEGNADQGGRRQVTILERERWGAVCSALGEPLDPRDRRANLLVSGVDLSETGGRILRVGPCRLRILGETTPCERMDQVWPGLRAALTPGWSGGVYGEVLDDGEVVIGDQVTLEDAGGLAPSMTQP